MSCLFEQEINLILPHLNWLNLLLLCRRRFPGMCSSHTTAQFTLPPKRQKMTGYVPAKASSTPKETWIHDFCVLTRQDENVTPSITRLNELLDAGLGKAWLSVQKNASHKELSTALENHFPKLKVARGFEFLCADGGGGGQRQLSLVYPSAFRYTVPHLRERFGQAVAYIHPLQTDLDESIEARGNTYSVLANA